MLMSKTVRRTLLDWTAGIVFALAILSFGVLAGDREEQAELEAIAAAKVDVRADAEVQLERRHEQARHLRDAHAQGAREALAGLNTEQLAALERTCAVFWLSHQQTR